MTYILIAQTPHGQCFGSCSSIEEALSEAVVDEYRFPRWLVLDSSGQVCLMSIEQWQDDVDVDPELVTFAQHHL